jgi:hypothetical protein
MGWVKEGRECIMDCGRQVFVLSFDSLSATARFRAKIDCAHSYAAIYSASLGYSGAETITMSEEFEIRGVHEDRLDEAGEHEPHGMAGQLAVMTAVLATVGALFAYMAGATQADAGLYKNDAAIKKTEAANQWNYYQAKGNKQNLDELGEQLAQNDAQKLHFAAEAARYKTDKIQIKLAAEKLERESTVFDQQSEAQMHQHHRWAQATTALQIAIAMAAMALLTRRRWLEKGVFIMSGVGLIVGVLAYLQI